MITKKQLQVYEIIMSFVRVHRYLPTVRDICKLTGSNSMRSAYGYLKRPKKNEIIGWESVKPHTLKIVQS